MVSFIKIRFTEVVKLINEEYKEILEKLEQDGLEKLLISFGLDRKTILKTKKEHPVNEYQLMNYTDEERHDDCVLLSNLINVSRIEDKILNHSWFEILEEGLKQDSSLKLERNTFLFFLKELEQHGVEEVAKNF